MTSLQIELPPDVYARLQDEAQRQGKAAHELAQEMLIFQLTSALPEPEQPLYLALAPKVQALVATMNIDNFIVPGDGSPEDAIALLRSWSEAETDDDEDMESWEDVLRSIDANRSSDRKLFPNLGPSE